MTGRAWVTTGVVLAVALGAAAPAGAAVRYAAPGGSGPAGTCPRADPCDLETAVEDGSVTDGDEVVVLPGDYDLGTEQLRPLDAVDLHGLAGQPRPRLTSSGAGETLDAFDDGTAIRHLEVTVSCGDEACEAALAGRAVAKKKGAGKGRRAAAAKKKGKKTFKVKPKALSLTAGETKTQRVRFKRNKKSVRKVRKLLKRKAYRRKTKAKIKVSATDAAGNAATERVKVKLKR